MKKRAFFRFIALLLFGSLFVECQKSDPSPLLYDKVVIIYMAANNNLSTQAYANIASMKEGYIPTNSGKEAIVVYQHIAGVDPEIVHYYRAKNGEIVEERVLSYSKHNSASGEVLQETLLAIKSKFPSKEYSLILWSHATGWLPEGAYTTGPFGVIFTDPYRDIVKSFGADETSEIDLIDLSNSLPYHFSHILFDCCFMGGIEVLYQLKDKCDFIVAAPTEILAEGFPYHKVMAPLFDKVNTRVRVPLDGVSINSNDDIPYKFYSPLVHLGQSIFEYYSNKQDQRYRSLALALYSTDAVEELAQVCSSIFEDNRAKLQNLNKNNIQRYFRFSDRWFWDLSNFIEAVATPAQYLQYEEAISKVVLARWNTPRFLTINFESYSGIGSYIPNWSETSLINYYKELEWNKAVKMVE